MPATVRFFAALCLAIGTTAVGQAVATPPPVAATYADLAALGLAAPVVLRATIARSERVDDADAPGLTANHGRLLITATTSAAIVAPGEIPATITYLYDAPLDARRKVPKLKGADVLLFLRGTAGTPGQFTLVSARGQLAWTPETDATVRSILTEARSGTVPVVSRVTSAFRVPGAVPGEAESQFFLATADGKPVSLVVLTRPGQDRRLTVALGDVIDDAAAGVKRNTLLWYRLACFLPPALPPGSASDPAVADDYAFVLASLGPCRRTI